MRSAFWLLVVILFACGAEEPVADSTGDTSTSTSTSTSAVTDSEAGVSTGSSTGDGFAGPGEPCGQVPCEDGLFCDPYEESVYCSDELPGTCKPPPETCSADAGPPVCGCDGVLYASKCHLRMASVLPGPAAACEAPEGFFPCGADYCQLEQHYCEFTIGHGQLETYFCRELPPSCLSATDCTCVPTASCTNPENIGGSSCEPMDGWMFVVCAPY